MQIIYIFQLSIQTKSIFIENNVHISILNAKNSIIIENHLNISILNYAKTNSIIIENNLHISIINAKKLNYQ